MNVGRAHDIGPPWQVEQYASRFRVTRTDPLRLKIRAGDDDGLPPGTPRPGKWTHDCISEFNQFADQIHIANIFQHWLHGEIELQVEEVRLPALHKLIIQK